VFQQTIGISMGTNCAPLLADLFLHAYEADFLQGLSQRDEGEAIVLFFHSICTALTINRMKQIFEY
jgi:hypothetical protein